MRRCTHRVLAAGAALAVTVVGRPLVAQVTPTADSAITPIKFMPPGPPTLNPTWVQWKANALQSLSHGGGTVGDPATDPAAYVPTGTITDRDFWGTLNNPGAVFNSWHAQANPAAPFDTQYGNAIIFPLRLVSTTSKFRLSNLDNITTSNDPGNDLGVSGTHLVSGANYGFSRVGIDYGPDGIRGTADDITYNNGESGTMLVNELLYSGVAVFEDVSHTPGNTPQQDIDQSIASFDATHPITRITNEYILTDDAGRNLVDVTKAVTVTPEPASLGLFALGTLSLLARRRAK
jgi:hypothetical protein